MFHVELIVGLWGILEEYSIVSTQITKINIDANWGGWLIRPLSPLDMPTPLYGSTCFGFQLLSFPSHFLLLGNLES